MELELSSGLSSLLIMLGLLRISLKVSSLFTSFLNDFFLTLDGFFRTLGGDAARDLIEGLGGTLSGVGRGAGRLVMEGEAESLDWEELMAPISGHLPALFHLSRQSLIESFFREREGLVKEAPRGQQIRHLQILRTLRWELRELGTTPQ